MARMSHHHLRTAVEYHAEASCVCVALRLALRHEKHLTAQTTTSAPFGGQDRIGTNPQQSTLIAWLARNLRRRAALPHVTSGNGCTRAISILPNRRGRFVEQRSEKDNSRRLLSGGHYA